MSQAMKRHRLRGKYRVVVGPRGNPFIQLLSSNKKRIMQTIALPYEWTVEKAIREAAKMFPEARNITP